MHPHPYPTQSSYSADPRRRQPTLYHRAPSQLPAPGLASRPTNTTDLRNAALHPTSGPNARRAPYPPGAIVPALGQPVSESATQAHPRRPLPVPTAPSAIPPPMSSYHQPLVGPSSHIWSGNSPGPIQPSHSAAKGHIDESQSIKSPRRPLPQPSNLNHGGLPKPADADRSRSGLVRDRIRALHTQISESKPDFDATTGVSSKPLSRALPQSPTAPPDLSRVPAQDIRGIIRSASKRTAQVVSSQPPDAADQEEGLALESATANSSNHADSRPLPASSSPETGAKSCIHPARMPMHYDVLTDEDGMSRHSQRAVASQRNVPGGENTPVFSVTGFDEGDVRNATVAPRPPAEARFTIAQSPQRDESPGDSNSHHGNTSSSQFGSSPKLPQTQSSSRRFSQKDRFQPPKLEDSAPQSLTFRLATMSLEEEERALHTKKQQSGLEDSPPKAFHRLKSKESSKTVGAPESNDSNRAAIPKISFPDSYLDEDVPPLAAGSSSGSVPKITFGGADSDDEDSQGPPAITISSATPRISVSSSDNTASFPSMHKRQSSSPDKTRGMKTPQNLKTIRQGGLLCGGCGESIVGRIVSAMNLRWHPHCFQCTVCGELLEHVSAYEHDGHPYCHLDYHERFGPQCYHCQTPIIDQQFITVDDPGLGQRTYHEQHFFCAECGDPFMKPSGADEDDVGFTVYKGYAYCEACHVRLRMPKCTRCKKSIRDNMPAVEALGGKWHQQCFSCAGCDKPFDDPAFFQRGNKPFCESCFSIIIKSEL